MEEAAVLIRMANVFVPLIIRDCGMEEVQYIKPILNICNGME